MLIIKIGIKFSRLSHSFNILYIIYNELVRDSNGEGMYLLHLANLFFRCFTDIHQPLVTGRRAIHVRWYYVMSCSFFMDRHMVVS